MPITKEQLNEKPDKDKRIWLVGPYFGQLISNVIIIDQEYIRKNVKLGKIVLPKHLKL